MTKAFKSDFIFRLTGFINPEILVDKIKMGQCIPGLKASLVKMLCDLRLQVSIQDGCNNILVRDYFNLHDKLTRNQQKALFVSYDHACGMCRNDILVKGKSRQTQNPPRSIHHNVLHRFQIQRRQMLLFSIVDTFSTRPACPIITALIFVPFASRRNNRIDQTLQYSKGPE